MGSTRKVAIGLGIAGGALLAAWLLTGSRKRKTKDFITRAATDLRNSFQKKTTTPEDTDVNYV